MPGRGGAARRGRWEGAGGGAAGCHTNDWEPGEQWRLKVGVRGGVWWGREGLWE